MKLSEYAPPISHNSQLFQGPGPDLGHNIVMADILYFSYIIPHSQSLMDTERGLFQLPLVISDPCPGHVRLSQSEAWRGQIISLGPLLTIIQHQNVNASMCPYLHILGKN